MREQTNTYPKAKETAFSRASAHTKRAVCSQKGSPRKPSPGSDKHQGGETCVNNDYGTTECQATKRSRVRRSLRTRILDSALTTDIGNVPPATLDTHLADYFDLGDEASVR